MHRAKPFAISKQEVWQAWQKIKANRGAAGVDRQTIEEFEQDLKGNLYKLLSGKGDRFIFFEPWAKEAAVILHESVL